MMAMLHSLISLNYYINQLEYLCIALSVPLSLISTTSCNRALGKLRKTDSLKAEKERILTLHPEKTIEKLHNIGKVEIAGATPHLRRIELVKRADAIITIEGSSGTKEIIELVVASKKPFNSS